MSSYRSSLVGESVAEFVGTFIMIFAGNSAVAAAVFLNAHNPTGVAILWGVCVAAKLRPGNVH